MLMSRRSGLGLTWSMMNIFSISHGKRSKDEREEMKNVRTPRVPKSTVLGRECSRTTLKAWVGVKQQAGDPYDDSFASQKPGQSQSQRASCC